MHIRSILIAALFAAAFALPAFAQEGIKAVVKLVEGDAAETVVITPDSDDWLEAEVGAEYPEGTEISTGDGVKIVLALEGSVDGTDLSDALLSVRENSEIKLDRLLVQDNSVVTRLKVKTGEIRVKVTEDKPEYATDMKVATPNATASVTGTDVHAIGFNANRGTYMAVASGSISAQSGGRTRNVTGGSELDGDSDSTLDAALNNASSVVAPIGFVAYEVKVGQLIPGGPERSASDLNNPSTNPNSGRGSFDNDTERGEEFDPGQTLPSTARRTNRR